MRLSFFSLWSLLLSQALLNSCSLISVGENPARQVSDQDTVSLNAALDFGKISFIRGCMVMGQYLKRDNMLPWCVQSAKEHMKGIHSIMEQGQGP